MSGETKWTPGTRVEAFDPHLRIWRPAVIEEDAPYRDRHGQVISHGARVRWCFDGPPAEYESAGGWIDESGLREARGETP